MTKAGEIVESSKFAKGKQDVDKEELNQQFSSSSNASNDDESEEEGSSSSSSSYSSSSQLSFGAQQATALVPPGQGSCRTRRNNRNRRSKLKRRNEACSTAQFRQAAERADKRARGEFIDEEAVARAWHYVEVCRTEKIERSVDEGRLDKTSPKEVIKAAVRSISQVLPPSQRQAPIPVGVRLTRVDCDEFFTPWPWEEDAKDAKEEGSVGAQRLDGRASTANVEDAYVLFQEKARESLRLMRREMEEKEDAGIQLVTEKEGEHEEAVFSPEAALTMGLPSSFGKKGEWDGMMSNGVRSFMMSTRARQRRSPSLLSDDVQRQGSSLADGGPENGQEGMQATLRRLRSLRRALTAIDPEGEQ